MQRQNTRKAALPEKKDTSKPILNASEQQGRGSAAFIFDQQQEALGLEGEHDNGRPLPYDGQVTPEALQAKMDDYWREQIAHARNFGHSFAEMAVYPPEQSPQPTVGHFAGKPPLQAKGGGSGQPIQCWYEYSEDDKLFIENNKFPPGKIPLGGYWVTFTAAHNQNIGETKRHYTPDLKRPSRWDMTNIQGDIHGTNDTKEKSKGCAIFVAADFLGITATAFLKAQQGKQEIMPLAMKLFRENGDPDTVANLYEALGILAHVETFNDHSDMITTLRETPDADWSGALAWEGHIVRAAGRGADFTAWDPQGGLSNYLLPSRTKIILITFP